MTSDLRRLKLTRNALKDLKTYKGDAAAVKAWLDILRSQPLAGHQLSGSLAGTRSLEFSLRGSGQHRAIYVYRELPETIIVVLIGPHENIYERAVRRFNALDLDLEE